MKPISPHDPLDDLIAAALHGELTPEERTDLDSRLQNDPTARAAYQEARLMHDLLEKTHHNAQPDSAFEQRMVSGVRRKIQHKEHRETAWESVLVLWMAITRFPKQRFNWVELTVIFGLIAVLAGVLSVSAGSGIKASKRARANINDQLQYAANDDLKKNSQFAANSDTDYDAQQSDGRFQHSANGPLTLGGSNSYSGATTVTSSGNLVVAAAGAARLKAPVVAQAGNTKFDGFINYGVPITSSKGADGSAVVLSENTINKPVFNTRQAQERLLVQNGQTKVEGQLSRSDEPSDALSPPAPASLPPGNADSQDADSGAIQVASAPQNKAASWDDNWKPGATPKQPSEAKPSATATTEDVSRKLIRNAELDLEIKNFQTAIDQVTALTKSAGGYVDTSNSQKGGNGKLQGTIVVKVLPQNLDTFLLKLRDLGQITNQSVKTDDVTKDYYDTQARLENSRKMETQLQDLLKRENGKVSDLLQVERELGRVRGEIEQMQGSLRMYDFQVAYATVTMQLHEKDLNQAAAYQLNEQDAFSLFATDVEATFQKARQTADDFKAQVLSANLNHNSGSDVSADLVVMVAPDQIESFLTQVRSLGRVANFTRQSQRVAKDGGDSDQPADETRTEKDKVQVTLNIRSDDETRKQVALTVVTATVDDTLDQAKAAAQAHPGVQILSSSLNKTPQGQSTAQVSVRVPGKDYHAVLDSFRALGRTASFSLQRDDNSGPGADSDDAPVIISLALTDDDIPLQQTQMALLISNVDQQAQQLKKDAATAGVEVKASSFARQPDGTESAQMTFRLPMTKYPAFVESLKKLGKVESLTVHRDDRPDQARTDESAPAEISLQLHNQGDLVTDDNGLWATLRQTFGEGAGALFGSVRMIGVLLAFALPWVFTLGFVAWIGRRVYLWRKR